MFTPWKSHTHTLTHTCRHMGRCVHVCVSVFGWACLLYNKHWSTTGPSCQVTAVIANNDYPLPDARFLLHNHQRWGDTPLLGEQCIHERASSLPTPTLISPLRICQTSSLCVFVVISTNLCVGVRFFLWKPLGPHSLPRLMMIPGCLELADYTPINTYGVQI